MHQSSWRPGHKTQCCSALPYDLNLHNLGLGNGFWHVTTKAQVTKGKTDKFNFIEIRNFCVSKGEKEVKRKTHRMGENVYISYVW